MGKGVQPRFERGNLGARQEAIIRAIHAGGGATVREIHARIPDPPRSLCGVRTLLNRLVARKLLSKRRSGRHSEILYYSIEGYLGPERSAFERLADEYFGGSRQTAVHALMRLAANEAGEGGDRYHLRLAHNKLRPGPWRLSAATCPPLQPQPELRL